MITGPILDFDIFREDHGKLWTDVALPMLTPAIKRLHGTHDAFDIVQMLQNKSLTLWVGDTVAAITEITVFPRMYVCNVFLTGGFGGLDEAVEWAKPDGVLDDWAFNRWHCARITYAGRKGWAAKVDYEVVGEMAMRTRA